MSELTNIKALLLAAGLSTRFESCKLLAEFAGRPLLQHSLVAAQTVFPGAVSMVVGHNQEPICSAADGLVDRIVVNPDYQRGIGSSIAAGVRAIADDADAIVLMLGDQPLITADDLHRLVAGWGGDTGEIVASVFEDGKGPPILFARDSFAELGELDGDIGARHVLASGNYDVQYVTCTGSARDVDTTEDLYRLGAS